MQTERRCAYYASKQSDSFSIPVASNMFMRTDWRDTIYKRILQSPLGKANRYVYSDNDFIFLGKIVEAISGMPLNEYEEDLYQPMGLTTAGFKPLEQFPARRIAPTEDENSFACNCCVAMYTIPAPLCSAAWPVMPGCSAMPTTWPMIMQMLLNGER